MIRLESRFLFQSLLLCAACTVAGCGSAPMGEDSVAALPLDTDSAGRVEDYVLVDCLLPGQIRRLGTSMTYLTPRRAVKATQRDCAIRGGEYVLFDRSDYRSALQTLLPKARAGDAVAQTYVGEIYEKGLGLPGPDYATAASWYRKAAEDGHGPAQISLGSLYERGLGVPKDNAVALDWYRRSTGLTQDRLVFESALKAERAAFQRELTLRNQVASSLRQQLRQAKQRKAPAGAPQAPAPRSASTQEIERLMESQQRDAQREAELREKKLRAVEQLRATESEGRGQAEGKAAQAGKLELSLRQEIDGLLDTSRRLAAAE
jgi:hypothetical protein